MAWGVADGVSVGESWRTSYREDIWVGSRSLGLYDVTASGLC